MGGPNVKKQPAQFGPALPNGRPEIVACNELAVDG
jgi:hypothetical protein